MHKIGSLFAENQKFSGALPRTPLGGLQRPPLRSKRLAGARLARLARFARCNLSRKILDPPLYPYFIEFCAGTRGQG